MICTKQWRSVCGNHVAYASPVGNFQHNDRTSPQTVVEFSSRIFPEGTVEHCRYCKHCEADAIRAGVHGRSALRSYIHFKTPGS